MKLTISSKRCQKGTGEDVENHRDQKKKGIALDDEKCGQRGKTKNQVEGAWEVSQTPGRVDRWSLARIKVIYAS